MLLRRVTVGLGGYETRVSGLDGWTGALIGVMVGESCSWTGVAVRLEGSWIVVPVTRERPIRSLVAMATVGQDGGWTELK